ncbi:MAG TPA: type VI secretion system lipoprotein TssJ [Polyangiaceae bacterium]|nr:type VI secretion system lipoprotein TssJ [Polyangiaceae bacterium]
MKTIFSLLPSRAPHWAFAAVAALGCSSTPPPEAAEPCDRQVVSAAIIATPLINPAENGEARPVQLRLYQLKNDVGFRNATFDQVWKEDAAKLGEDLLGSQEVSVYPDSRKQVDFERNPEAQFVVAAALFRTPKGKQWFTSFELPPPPGQEACGAKCEDGKCAEPTDLNPKIYVRVDGTRVNDGADYADEFPAKEVAQRAGGLSL